MPTNSRLGNRATGNCALQTALAATCQKLGLIYRRVSTDGCWHTLAPINGTLAVAGRAMLFEDKKAGVVLNFMSGQRLAFFAANATVAGRKEYAQTLHAQKIYERKRREALDITRVLMRLKSTP